MATKPAYELRRGLIKVRVWRKKTRSGPRYSLAITRLFRNGDRWQQSSRFGRDGIPLVRLLLDEAYGWIFRQMD